MQEEIYQVQTTPATRQLTRVAVFEENKNVRNNILNILRPEVSIEIVGIYNNVNNFIRNLLHAEPDLVIMDISAAGLKGIQAVERLREELPQIQILIQTSNEDNLQIYHALQAGASGYILKSDLRDKLLQSIKDIRSGGFSMSPQIAKKVIEMMKRRDCHFELSTVDYKLTAREKEVLSCIVKGKSYKMAAVELNISYETVRSHIKNIYEKLQVTSLTELVAKSINFHIV
ncbi:DNA-binding response regulator [Mucilaginibacter conchicola]|uniref:DNA-binding response regulator n=1 Tax=Mucilaginibacter conchicola TaxID=2303333 RepID=A0A372NPH0_9SPHI|nr:response regulator transcription factor [Mucilaginibacter conchicola]RFZ90265.1 DNA-binding response regulator [Mucilaginibacter conchicola]